MPEGYSTIKQDVHIVYQPIKNFRDNIEIAENLVAKNEMYEVIRMVVSAFETYCEEKFEAMIRKKMGKEKDQGKIAQNRIEEIVKENERGFQDLQRCKEVYKKHLGIDLPIIDQKAWCELFKPFRKRHQIAHRSGIIDEEYIEEIGRIQNGYKEEGLFVGGRIVISEEEAKRAISNVEKIVEGIEIQCSKLPL